MDRPLTLDEFMIAIRPELERQIDEFLLAQTPADRALLARHRNRLVDKLADCTKIANLEKRLAEAEARLKPRLVES